MKIVVLNNTNFIAKAFISKLEASGYTIISLSLNEILLDLPQTRRYFAEILPDAIINCAVFVGGLHHSIDSVADTLHTNIQIILNLYKIVQDTCPNSRIVNLLSNCSYPGIAEFQSESNWLNGDVHPSVYASGNSYRFLYVMAKCYSQQYKTVSINFIAPNIFGPGDSTDPNRTYALNGMIIRMIKAKRDQLSEFRIWGTGKPIREWAYIDDVVNILQSGLTISKDVTTPVNIAQNYGYSISESAKIIAEAINFKGTIEFDPSYQDGAPCKVMDDKRFRTIFPNYFFIDHSEAIRRTVEYYKSVL